MQIDDLLRIAVERKASDLHLKVGNFPYLRVDGALVALGEVKRLSAEDMLNMAFSMMTNRQKQKFKESAELDLAYGIAGLGRFRVNVFQQRGNVGMVLRVVPTKIRSFEELNLPRVIYKICEERRCMVLVTGTTGSGKSTTLASMIDRINATRNDHIITIEDPIEFLHRDKKGIVNQREVEVDTHNFSVALRAALRQDPDVILVGEMRDLEAIAAGTSQYGMQTFDQSLYDLYSQNLITYDEALNNASNPDDFKLRVQGIRSTADVAREDMQSAMESFEGDRGRPR